MTRIHKKPGSAAWKRSVQKSAGRMARDLLRMPEGKQSEVLASYLRNKGESEKVPLLQVIREAKTRREYKKLEIIAEISSLTNQIESIYRGLKVLKNQRGKSEMSLRQLKHLRGSVEVTLNNVRRVIAKIDWLEKNYPKEKLSWIKNRRSLLEQDAQALAEQIAIVDKRIAQKGGRK